jgi:tetratricopeptide (TPR) repeat protein
MPPSATFGDAAEGPPPPVVEGITVGALLGIGGFASVWSAARARDGREVALKVAHGDAAALAERFRREALAMTLVGPPAVPALFAEGHLDDGRPYLVMERLSGDTLATRLAALPRAPELAWIERVGDEVLAALAAVHDRGLVHRDVKPENIFFSDARPGAPAGRAVLLDLGLAKGQALGGADLTRVGAALGTPEYMAPEQLRGEQTIDARADLYAFGVVLFELLTLRPPFVGAGAEVEHGHLALRPPRPSELAPVPASVEEIVLGCLAKHPDRRPASAAALRRALADAYAQERAPGPRAAVVAGGAAAKVLADGRHPVVVAVVDAVGGAAPVAATVAGRGGLVPRQRGSRYVAVFTGSDTEDPVRAALAAARTLVERHGARAALHLADVTLRRRERGAPTVLGAAVDRPETWLPAEPWTGLHLTAELTRVLPEGARAEAAPSSVDELALHVEAPSIGRAPALDALAASASLALHDGHPALFTLLGDHGLGKTHLAREAAAVARRTHGDALVLMLRPAPPAAGEGVHPAAELLRQLLDAPATAPADPRAHLVEHLGAEVGGDTWEETAALLGWTQQGDGGDGAPAHQRLLRALAEGLRRRAARGPVAVILDDAQWAEDALLDALEYATLDGDDRRLWVVVIANPRFAALRPGWGARTQHAARAVLSPLDPGATADLAARLLAPAEYPPAAVLERLGLWSGGNPASLVELVRALKRAGFVKRRASGQSYYVATADLDALPPSPAWQWLTARRLAAVPRELAACLRLGAVLGVSFSRDELERVVAAIDAARGASTPVDVGIGLGALAEEGLLTRSDGERYSFPNALLHDAVYEQLDPAQRVETHRAALAVWQARAAGGEPTAEVLERVARHAGAAGARDAAAEACLQLGDLAASAHRHVEADQRYTAALGASREDDARRRARALGGRGRSRVHIDRTREAVEDLVAARALAVSVGDDHLVAELLLEEATVLDWTTERGLSAERAEEARPLVAALGDPVLAARLQIADGRTAWRRGELLASIEILERGVAAARAVNDYGSLMIGLLCLAFQLAVAGRTDDSEPRFTEVMALTSSAGDRLHLCVAYLNRTQLWLTRMDQTRAADDLQRASTLARELGNPTVERQCCYNVAELAYLCGSLDEARVLALRGRMLDDRFSDRPDSQALILARIHLELGETLEAQRLVDWIERVRPTELFDAREHWPSRSLSLGIVKLVLAELGTPGPEPANATARWAALVEEVRRHLGGGGLDFCDLLEVLCWRARMAGRGGRSDEARDAIALAEAHLERAPKWGPRFEALRQTERLRVPGAC